MGRYPPLFTRELDQNNDSLAANCKNFSQIKKRAFYCSLLFRFDCYFGHQAVRSGLTSSDPINP
jgi:hypothetical protein